MAEFQALLRAKAEWKPHQIAKAGNIKELAEGAAALANTVKDTLGLAAAAMEIVKFLAMLQSINPLLMALDALADEVLKQVQDLKEAGFWYLYIDPYFIKNVTASPTFTYGFEQLRNAGGERLWLYPDDFGKSSGQIDLSDSGNADHADFYKAWNKHGKEYFTGGFYEEKPSNDICITCSSKTKKKRNL